MKFLFVAAGGIEWGSSRMRAYWVAEEMDDAVAMTLKEADERRPAAEIVVFQKTVRPALLQYYAEKGSRIFWDLCDPSWWFEPQVARETISLMDGVVCSSAGLASDLVSWTRDIDGRPPISVIEDRLSFRHFDSRIDPVPANFNRRAKRMIWYGMSQNRISLAHSWALLDRLKANGVDFELTIFDNSPQSRLDWGQKFTTAHIKWDLDSEVQVLTGHDVALLPPYPGAWGKVKSDNKKRTAKAVGLPVFDGMDFDELRTLLTDEEYWMRASSAAYRDARDNYDVRQSARDWETLVS